MAIEIEKKFLVKSDRFKNLAISSDEIVQAYISRTKQANVRVRTYGNKGFITIKGKSDKKKISRKEWEFEIPLKEAKELIEFSEFNIIEKTRFLIPEKSGLMFEVDVFKGKNKGLVIAEIELNSENQSFEKPDWLGKEVTQDKRYFNSYLAKNPYQTWEK